MYKSLYKINEEIKKLDKLYKDDLIPKKDYREKLEYLKECASFLKHENRSYKAK